jgi:hypothetical protein
MRAMDIHQLGKLRLQTGENGSAFYEKLGEERAAALLTALLAHGYRIVSERELAARRVSSTPSVDDAQRTAGWIGSHKPRRSGAVSQMGD